MCSLMPKMESLELLFPVWVYTAQENLACIFQLLCIWVAVLRVVNDLVHPIVFTFIYVSFSRKKTLNLRHTAVQKRFEVKSNEMLVQDWVALI